MSAAFRFISCLVFCYSFDLNAQTDTAHPNIILIISDDLGVDITNGYQNNNLMPTTPTLDSLRQSGITFANAWATPVCTPTRSTIMSGKYGIKTGVTGVPGNLDLTDTSVFNKIKTYTNSLYSGAVIGKWHISQSQTPNYNHPQQHGVDHYEGVFESGVQDYYSWSKITNGVPSNETQYVTSNFTDAAISWVNAQNNPWFLWLAEVAPHAPFHVPPSNLYSINSTGNNIRKYVAAIEAMDSEIGRLFRNIPDSVLDNTIIIYLGDNGTPGQVIQNYPTGHAKGSLYQGGIHVPMFISGAKVSRVNQTESALIQSVDIYATLIELMGVDLPGGMYNSLSFLPLLSGGAMATRDYSYSELTSTNTTGWTIRNNQYKLIEFSDGSQEFYDLLNDPLEITDLSGSLNTGQQNAKMDLEQEAQDIRNQWSCRDHIQNGDEDGIDCGGSFCAPCSIGIEENRLSQRIEIYPNPAEGLIHISAEETINYCKIYSLQGKLLLEIQGDSQNNLKVSLRDFPAQMLVVELQLDTELVRKIIIR